MAEEIDLQQIIANANSTIAMATAASAGVGALCQFLVTTDVMPQKVADAVKQVMLAHLEPREDGTGPHPALHEIVQKQFG